MCQVFSSHVRALIQNQFGFSGYLVLYKIWSWVHFWSNMCLYFTQIVDIFFCITKNDIVQICNLGYNLLYVFYEHMINLSQL